MGIRDKEKARADIKSNVGAIVGKEEKPEAKNFPEDLDLTQKAYYITKAQHRRLKILAASREADMSCLIREMLDKYLNDYNSLIT